MFINNNLSVSGPLGKIWLYAYGGYSRKRVWITSMTILADWVTLSIKLPALALLASVALSGVRPEPPGDDDIMLDETGDIECTPGHEEATPPLRFLWGLSRSLDGVFIAIGVGVETSDVMSDVMTSDDAADTLNGDAKERLIRWEVSPHNRDLKMIIIMIVIIYTCFYRLTSSENIFLLSKNDLHKSRSR